MTLTLYNYIQYVHVYVNIFQLHISKLICCLVISRMGNMIDDKLCTRTNFLLFHKNYNNNNNRVCWCIISRLKLIIYQ